MDKVPSDPHLRSNNNGTDDPCVDPVTTRGERFLSKVVRSRWLAMFAVAFAVSWSFHQVDEIQTHKLERTQRVLTCTIQGVAVMQQRAGTGGRVRIAPILKACEKLEGKE